MPDFTWENSFVVALNSSISIFAGRVAYNYYRWIRQDYDALMRTTFRELPFTICALCFGLSIERAYYAVARFLRAIEGANLWNLTSVVASLGLVLAFATIFHMRPIWRAMHVEVQGNTRRWMIQFGVTFTFIFFLVMVAVNLLNG